VLQVVQYFSDITDVNEYINFVDHDGYPPKQKWVTDEIITQRKARQKAEEEAKAAAKEESAEKDEL
jgi:hypothetical protein